MTRQNLIEACGDSLPAARPQVRLRLPAGILGYGFVTVRLPNRAKVRYELRPRHARVLYALARRWAAQSGDDYEPSERGWCAIDSLLDAIDSWTDYRPTKDALRRYIATVLQTHRAAVQNVAAEPPIPIIERRRQLGARISPQIDFELICAGTEPGVDFW